MVTFAPSRNLKKKKLKILSMICLLHLKQKNNNPRKRHLKKREKIKENKK